MKKNFKFLSSIALAGVLATNVVGLPTFAATTDNTTRTETLGIYQKLVEGKKNVVPFVLAHTEDRVTIKDIKDSGKFNNISKVNGLAVPNEDNTVLCTGDTFTADSKDYTVVVYGDVNKDGVLDVDDAVAVQKNIVGTQELDAIQKEAADVKNDGEIDVDDAVAIKKYIVGNSNKLLDPLPEKEQEESIQYNCEIKVNDNDYINSENVKDTKVGIKLSQTYEEKTELTIKVLNARGQEIDVTGLSGKIEIEPHKDYKEQGPASFENITDKNITIQILDEDGAIVGTTTVEINTIRPEAALISTERTSTTDATMSFSAQGESDIVKMYYTVVNSEDTKEPEWDPTKNEFKEKTTKTINVSNNKLENALVSNELKTKGTYKVYYVLENSYGSRSEEPQIADILSDTVNGQIAKVETIKVPDFSKKETKFTWEASENAIGYIVTIYKDGTIVAEDSNVTTTEYDAKAVMDENGAGKYKISVIAKGDNTKFKNSEATQSTEVEKKALKAVTNIAFEIDTKGKSILSWKDSNDLKNVKEYQINLYQLKENGNFDITPVSIKADETKTEITIEANVVYKAEVIAVAQDDQVEIVNSTEATLEGFYKIEANVALGDKITENSANLTLNAVKVNGKSATYQVKIYSVNEDYNPEEALYTLITTKDVVYKDGEIVIDGLEPNKEYAFKLIASIDGIQGESNYIPGAHTLIIAPEIKNLTVVKKEEEAKAGTIYKNANTFIVNGETIKLSSNYSDQFKKMVEVIEKLHANDIVTIQGESITLKLPSEASSKTLDFEEAAKGMTVVIEGNGFEKEIAATKGNEPKEVTLKGTNARFNVSELNAEEMIASNGVIVTGDKEITVVAGATVTINGIKVTTQKETIINAEGKNLNVTANTESNNLVFENLIAENIDETDAVITFVGKDNNSSEQLGTITIKTEGGKITVAQQQVNVSSTLNVEVNTGTVVVDDVALNGNKNITVTNKEEGTTTVNARAKIKAPVAMKGVELKDYTQKEWDELMATLNVTKEDDIAAVKAYMNSFGINGKGAKIEVEKDSENVTITFEKAVTNVQISGIQ